MIKYKVVPWEFNHVAWSAAMAQIVDSGDMEALAELTELSTAAIRNWAKGVYTEGYQYPRMTNFLKICNVLDINPQEFFTTGWD